MEDGARSEYGPAAPAEKHQLLDDEEDDLGEHDGEAEAEADTNTLLLQPIGDIPSETHLAVAAQVVDG